jgi:hypothetical protein
MSDLDVTLPNVRSDALQRRQLEALAFVGPSTLGAAPLVQPPSDTLDGEPARGTWRRDAHFQSERLASAGRCA